MHNSGVSRRGIAKLCRWRCFSNVEPHQPSSPCHRTRRRRDLAAGHDGVARAPGHPSARTVGTANSVTSRLEKIKQRKILIMGLTGSGKTTPAATLAPLLNAVVFNADAVRANLSRDLGFSHEDRVEHARRMGWMCDRVVEAAGTVIADFICPTPKTRAAFGEAFVIWVDRIEAGRFEDTNRMFVAPEPFDVLHVPVRY